MVKPKKLSMQEQMLADAMVQAGLDEDKVKAVGSTVESKSGKKHATYGGSLDSAATAKKGAGGGGGGGGVTGKRPDAVVGIVKQKRPAEAERSDKEILDVGTDSAHVFTSAIEELD